MKYMTINWMWFIFQDTFSIWIVTTETTSKTSFWVWFHLWLIYFTSKYSVARSFTQILLWKYSKYRCHPQIMWTRISFKNWYRAEIIRMLWIRSSSRFSGTCPGVGWCEGTGVGAAPHMKHVVLRLRPIWPSPRTDVQTRAKTNRK